MFNSLHVDDYIPVSHNFPRPREPWIAEAPQSRPGRLEVANQVNSGLGKDRPRSQSNLPASILLVDDFEPWRRSVRSSLEPHQQLQIVGEARRIRSRPKGPGVEAGPDFAGYRSPQPERNRSRKSDRSTGSRSENPLRNPELRCRCVKGSFEQWSGGMHFEDGRST